MNKLLICLIFIALSAINAFAQHQFNVPEQTAFNDQSALNVKSNLQSQQYQDFIHQLYRFDKDNLMRADNLFAKIDKPITTSSIVAPSFASTSTTTDYQLSYADYIRAQQPATTYFGISQDSTKRYKRSAQGAIFRPLFVYRIFQERTLEREEERIRRRRVHANRRRTYLNCT